MADFINVKNAKRSSIATQQIPSTHSHRFLKPTDSLDTEVLKTYIAFGCIFSSQVKKELLHIPIKYWPQM